MLKSIKTEIKMFDAQNPSAWGLKIYCKTSAKKLFCNYNAYFTIVLWLVLIKNQLNLNEYSDVFWVHHHKIKILKVFPDKSQIIASHKVFD